MSSTPAQPRRRFYRVDLDFWHKRTCDRLLAELGPWGPCVWLALIAEAKRAHLKGTVIVTGEPQFWQLLGLYGDEHRIPPFTMNEFLTLTGRLKQTSRTPVGRLLHITLTRFGEWQKDAAKEDDRDRKNTSKTDGFTPETTPEASRNENRTYNDFDFEYEELPAERKKNREPGLYCQICQPPLLLRTPQTQQPLKPTPNGWQTATEHIRNTHWDQIPPNHLQNHHQLQQHIENFHP